MWNNHGPETAFTTQPELRQPTRAGPPGKPVRPHPVIWTDERVEAWCRDGIRPPVAVWTLDPLLGEVSGGVVGPGVGGVRGCGGASSVVVPGVLCEDRPQVSFTEDQHPVGDLRAGGEHEPSA